MRKLAARILVLALAALLVLAVYVAAHVIMTPPAPYYTDGRTIRQELAGAPLRQVLWNPPAPIAAPVATADDEHEAHISPDGQRLYFVRGRPGHNADLYVAPRVAGGSGGGAGGGGAGGGAWAGAWGDPGPLAAINTPADDSGPALSPDGRTLYFHSNRAGGAGGYDLWSATRDGADGWTAPVNLGPAVNSPDDEYGVCVAFDGATLYFASNRPRPGADPAVTGAYDLYGVAHGAGFGVPYPLDDLNSPFDDGAPALSPVGDFLYFASNRPGGRGGFDVYRSRRMPDGFAPPANLDAPVNTAANEIDPAVAEHGFVLLFSSDRARDGAAPRGYDLYASASREVFRAADDRGVPWGAILRLVAPLLPWLVVGILLALLLPLVAKLLRGDSERLRPLTVLARCLLLSLAAHAVVVLVSMAWAVAAGIPDMIGRSTRGTRVALTSSAIGNRVATQILGALAEADPLDPAPAALARMTPRADKPVEAASTRLDPGTLFALPEAPRPARDGDDAAPRRADVPVRAVDPGELPPPSPPPPPPPPGRLAAGARVADRERPAPTATFVSAAPARATHPGLEPGPVPATAAVPLPASGFALPAATAVSTPARPADAATDATMPRAARPTPAAPVSAPVAPSVALRPVSAIAVAEPGPDPAPAEPARVARTRAAAPTRAPEVTVSVAPEVSVPGAPPTRIVRRDVEAPGPAPTLVVIPSVTVAIEAGRAVPPIPEPRVAVTGADAGGTGRAASPPIAAPPPIATRAVSSADPLRAWTPSRARLAPAHAGMAPAAPPRAPSSGRARDAEMTRSVTLSASSGLPPASHVTLPIDVPDAGGAALTPEASEVVTAPVAPGAVPPSRQAAAIVGAPAAVTRLDPVPARGQLPDADAARSLPAPRGAGSTASAVRLASVPAAPRGLVGAPRVGTRGVGAPVGALAVEAPGSRAARRETTPPPDAIATGADARVGRRDAGDARAKTRVLPPAKVPLALVADHADHADPADPAAAADAPVPGAGASSRDAARIPPLARIASGSVPRIPMPPIAESAHGAAATPPGETPPPPGVRRRVNPARVAAPPRAVASPARIASVATGAPRREEASREEASRAVGRIHGSAAPPIDPPRRSAGAARPAARVATGSGDVRRPQTPARTDGEPAPHHAAVRTGPDAEDRRGAAIGPASPSRLARLPARAREAGSGTPPRAALPAATAALPIDTRRLPEVPDPARLPALPPVDAPPVPEHVRATSYPQRAPARRAESLVKHGGDARTEKAVADALDWLVRHQSADGRWDGSRFDDACGRCNGAARREVSTAVTAIALLSYFAADHTHVDDGPYRDTVARGLEWMLSRQSDHGDFIAGETMYTHGACTIALAEAYGLTGDETLLDPLERAVAFVVSARNRFTGGWRYVPGQDGDTSVLGWQIMALISARRAGVDVPDEALRGATKWLRRVDDPHAPGRYAYRPSRAPTPSMTAEAMYVRQLLGVPANDPAMQTSAAMLLDNLPEWNQSQSSYYWFYGSLALFQHGEPAWSKWNERMKDTLLTQQAASGPAAGSWAPDDVWAQVGGRVYQTALCALTLEVYYRYLPLYLEGG